MWPIRLLMDQMEGNEAEEASKALTFLSSSLSGEWIIRIGNIVYTSGLGKNPVYPPRQALKCHPEIPKV